MGTQEYKGVTIKKTIHSKCKQNFVSFKNNKIIINILYKHK